MMKTKNVVTKKISFSDDFGLTKAVIELRKTMTRKIIPLTDADKTYLDTAFDWDLRESVIKDRYAKYKVGEIVAVAQSYKSVFEESLSYAIPRYHWLDDHIDLKGFDNKMFVKASEMPHQIQITGIKVERLQDISDEDCLKEGFSKEFRNNGWGNAAFHEESVLVYYDKLGLTKTIRSKYPKEAFAALIDKVYGSGTWESNPYVFAYSFKLIK